MMQEPLEAISDQGRRPFARRRRVSALPGWRSPVWTLVLLAVVLLLLMLNLWGLRPFGYGSVDYEAFGDIATWSQGIGTVAAVIVALRTLQRQSNERLADIRRQEQRERTQVFCWMSFAVSDSNRDDDRAWYVCFNNVTPLPIAAWVLRVRDGSDEKVVGTLDVNVLEPIVPGFSRFRTGIRAGRLSEPVCELEFVDMAGYCWRRSSTGALAPIDRVVVRGQVAGLSPTAADGGS
jgi:hypothetical protein